MHFFLLSFHHILFWLNYLYFIPFDLCKVYAPGCLVVDLDFPYKSELGCSSSRIEVDYSNSADAGLQTV